MVVAIIDSGLNINHKGFKIKPNVINKIHIYRDETGEITHNDDIEDTVGHGTSVTWIISKYVHDIEFVIVKIIDDQNETDENILIYALNYIKENIKCDAINISAGLRCCARQNDLEETCISLYEKGIWIVCAFDNEGSMSYPASFQSTIGVDISSSCFTPNEYFYIEDSLITVRGMGYAQLLPTLPDSFCKQSGASFVAPHITGMICRAKTNGNLENGVKSFLKKNAKGVLSGKYEDDHKPLVIKNAAIYPISKETKVLIENAEMLPFKITHIYDLKYSGNVGKKVSQIVFPGCNIEDYLRDIVIEPVNKIMIGDDIDTIIIGHVNMLNSALGHVNIKEKLLKMAMACKRQVYMYDEIDCSKDILEAAQRVGCEIRIPRVSSINVPKQRYGKLFQQAVPVLGIFGTSPKQGKFTLQLRLRKGLSDEGYKVANLGTEPESELFGFEATYPIGLNSTVSLSGKDAVAYLNEKMHKIEKDEPDLIIVGSQSQSIATGNDSLGYMPISQYELIMGTLPDAYILCVNTIDEIEYIKRTINYLTSVTPAKVIAVVISPIVYQIEGGYFTKIVEYVNEERMCEYINLLHEQTGIPSYSLNNDLLVKELQKRIEDFFI